MTGPRGQDDGSGTRSGPKARSGPDPVEIPIDGTLDLHTFSPREVKDLIVPEYLLACRGKGILEVLTDQNVLNRSPRDLRG